MRLINQQLKARYENKKTFLAAGEQKKAKIYTKYISTVQSIKSEESFRNILCGLGREERVGLGVAGDPSGTGPERDPSKGIIITDQQRKKSG